MIPAGDLGVEEMSNGQWRWKYETVGGASWLGERLHNTKAAARAAGRKWLQEHQDEPPDLSKTFLANR